MAEANDENVKTAEIEKSDEQEQQIPVVENIEPIAALSIDKEIPIEDLRKLYTSSAALSNPPVSKEDQNDGSTDDDDDDSDQQRLLIAENPSINENGEDENIEDGSSPSYWRKSINIGDQYQAAIPDLNPTIDVDSIEDELFWAPDEEKTQDESSSNLMKFLKNASKEFRSADQEIVLKVFLSSNYESERALNELRSSSTKKNFVQSNSWSLPECDQFEQCFKEFGKNFSMFKIPNRSIKDLIYFYYIWKKTVRHDVFVRQNRVEKRRFHLHPFVTDYLEKFFVEQELQLTHAFEQNNGSLISSLNPQLSGDPLLTKRRLSSDLFLKPNLNVKRSKSSMQSNDQDLNRADSPSTNRSSSPTTLNKKLSDENKINSIGDS